VKFVRSLTGRIVYVGVITPNLAGVSTPRYTGVMTPSRVCKVDGCDRPIEVVGTCQMHYQRIRKHGSYDKRDPRWGPLRERLWAKVQKTETCWFWTGAHNGTGYGQIAVGSKKFYVHRLSWEWARGPIPKGLQVDHLCMVRHCVNPDHMEIVTPKVNCNRGYGAQVSAAIQLAKTHCPQGHEYVPENIRLNGKGGRGCRECGRVTARRWQAATRDARQIARNVAGGLCVHLYCRQRPDPESLYCPKHEPETQAIA
jgi:hypothetical protein